jgi:hypothetical protein
MLNPTCTAFTYNNSFLVWTRVDYLNFFKCWYRGYVKITKSKLFVLPVSNLTLLLSNISIQFFRRKSACLQLQPALAASLVARGVVRGAQMRRRYFTSRDAPLASRVHS